MIARLQQYALTVVSILLVALFIGFQLKSSQLKALEAQRAVDQMEAQAQRSAADELRRQLFAAEQARTGLVSVLARREAESTLAYELREQEIADYEEKLLAAGRSCRLDDADIEFLRK